MIVANTTDSERPAAVYRLLDEAGNRLYIGSSYDPDKRCAGHREKPWWPEVASRTDEWHATRALAFSAELTAIGDEEPRHNIYGTERVTDALLDRAAKSRARGAIQREAYRVSWEVYMDAVDNGLPSSEAYRISQAALTDFIAASGMFPAWVERLRSAANDLDREETGSYGA